ncbi:hypothetical protein LJR098_002186 [Rhizobium sp. LjRoot98]|uniref:hypothetical protein n=1 Tax=Rhizobium sp. LjRoot98 TaxID=3342345 RepID=UPI003ED056A5
MSGWDSTGPALGAFDQDHPQLALARDRKDTEVDDDVHAAVQPLTIVPGIIQLAKSPLAKPVSP